MKKLSALLALVLAICLTASCGLAEAGLEKYAEPVEVHFVRSTDDTLDTNFFANFPDKTMEDNLWCDLYRDELNIIVKYDWIVKSGDEYDTKLNTAIAVGDIPEFVNVSTLQLSQLVEADAIMPLEDIYEQYATPFTRQILESDGLSPFQAATIWC